MALRITRRIGESFDLIWPSGEKITATLIAPKLLRIAGAPLLVEWCKIGPLGSTELAEIRIGEPMDFDPSQHPIIIGAPSSVLIHRDNMKKGAKA